MHLGLRPRVFFPTAYKNFQLIRTLGRVFGVPAPLDARELLIRGLVFTHPAVLSAATREELEVRIDSGETGLAPREIVGSVEAYDLVRHRGSLHAVPRAAGWVDLDLAEERH